MESISYSSLLSNRPALAPVPVAIEGLDKSLLIHQFTLADYAVVTANSSDNDERDIRVQILRFLGGLNADVSDDAIAQLNTVFTAFQLREIFQKAVRLNGHGPLALGDAEKK